MRNKEMKKITKDNQIISSPAFQKDATEFALIIQNIDIPEVELYSDEENYLICRGKVEWPVWVWTKDNISSKLIPEIITAMNLYLTDEERTKFTCKKELYDLLASSGYENLVSDDYFEMGSLTCKNPISPKPCEGALSIPTIADEATLTTYWYADCEEMNGVDSITLDQAQKDVQSFLTSGTFFIWRDSSSKIVSMASYKQNGSQARLSHVYTPPEERKKGYAANLIYAMTKELLAKNLTPLLYTDYNYIPSNKAYINAGYEETGVLINFSCSKEPNKNKTL